MIEQSVLGSQGLGPLYGVVAFYLTDGQVTSELNSNNE